jgi:hypothetical protein
MTAFDRFDPFERRISEAIDGIAAARRPEYLDDILRQTARTSQRPRWTFPERWLPLDTALARPGFMRGVPLRSLLFLALVALLALAAAAFIIGSRQRELEPFGLATNGAIAYVSSGDIYVRDSLTGVSRLLIGGPGTDAFPFFSPNGKLIGFSTTGTTGEFLKVANADGSNVRQLLDDPIVAAGAVWRPDSRAMAVDTTIGTAHKLLIVPVDGTPVTTIDLGALEPMNVVWQPPSGATLLFRATDQFGQMDLYSVHADGTGLKHFGLPGQTSFGAEFTLGGAVWAPDGKTIAYNSIGLDQSGTFVTHFRVGLLSPDGTSKILAGPADPRVQEAWPHYSPDGKWLLVHRWVFKGDSEFAKPEGWIAVIPADGSGTARDIGPRVPGGEDSGLTMTWSPDGTRVLAAAGNTQQVFSIDPLTGAYDTLPWTTELPDWQRVATP